ncbi:MAG: flippase [Desulfuromonadaceae bacterium]|nr:flippase [Desulfuromonadaceae bacterium]MDD5106911.1 flippase [Desulfuromonadaceae bacterium]
MLSPWTKYLPAFIRRKLEDDVHLKDVVKNTGWMMGDKVVRMGIGLLVGVWLARYLGPALYGEFSYALAFALLFSPVAMLGMDEIVIRKLVHDTTKSEEILGTVFFLMLMGGVAVFILAVGAIFLVRPDDTLMHWLVAIIMAGTVLQAFLAIEFWFESQLQWKFTVYAKLTAFLFINIIKIILILTKASLLAFAWAGLSEIFLACVGLIITYRAKGYSLARWSISGSLARELLTDSWPVIFSVFLTSVYLKIDQVMIGNMTGNVGLGLYSAAVRLTEAWNFIPMAICSSVFPAIVAAAKKDELLFLDRMQKLYNLMVLIAYVISIPVTLFADKIVNFLFSSSYKGSGSLLAVLIWSLTFTNLTAARNILVLTKSWLRINLVSTLLGCLLNIALNYALIPTYGAMGATVASLISYWFAVHGTCFIFKPLRNAGWMITKALIYPKIW